MGPGHPACPGLIARESTGHPPSRRRGTFIHFYPFLEIRGFAVTLRGLIAVTVLLAVAVQPAPAGGLGVGDAAPKLTVKEFVKGKAVTRFEKGKVYAIEFWATWCSPCRQMVPHLTALQQKYPDVTFIGVSVAERDPSKVKPFVKEMGEKMKYRVAIDSVPEGVEPTKGAMVQNWMAPADQDAIPTVFIVDGDGKIAWIGYPGEMETPLEKIRAGKWDLKALRAERVARGLVTKAASFVEKLGGKAVLDEEGKSVTIIDWHESQVADADLKKLKGLEGLKGLQQLVLVDTKVTDAGLEGLKDLKELQVLFLGGTRVTNAGLKDLRGLKGLQRLGLARTRVTDAGLKELEGLKNLRLLFLTGTEVTEAGRASLKKALPKLQIVP
jgi:thiol-disulfide isomerase/thioredoxin